MSTSSPPTRRYLYVVVEFRSQFSSYSPSLAEGYIGSTSLHAAVMAAVAMLGHGISDGLAEARFSSLLPVARGSGGYVALFPPLRLPSYGKVPRGFWTPRAVSLVLSVLSSCSGRGADIVLERGGDNYVVRCMDGGESRELVYSRETGVFAAPGEQLDFRPPGFRSDRHRLVISRVTYSATPFMIPVVEPRSPYWFVAELRSEQLCGTVVEALRLAEHLGMGAHRSIGLGRIRIISYECTESPPSFLAGSRGGGIGVSLGLLYPEQGSCSVYYGETALFGAYRGYGGVVISFRRPLVRALAPGSIVGTDCRGRVIRGNDYPYVYSFNPIVYPVAPV